MLLLGAALLCLRAEGERDERKFFILSRQRSKEGMKEACSRSQKYRRVQGRGCFALHWAEEKYQKYQNSMRASKSCDSRSFHSSRLPSFLVLPRIGTILSAWRGQQRHMLGSFIIIHFGFEKNSFFFSILVKKFLTIRIC